MNPSRWSTAAQLAAVASSVPERVCVVADGRRVTYRELASRANRFGNALLARGIRMHDLEATGAAWSSPHRHVAICLHNCAELLQVLIGSMAARAAPSNAGFRYDSSELAAILDRGTADVLVFHAAFAERAVEAASAARVRPLLVQVDDDTHNPLAPGAVPYEDLLASAPVDPPPTSPSGDDLHIMFTGGTTGAPKPTLWSQADLYRAALAGCMPPSVVAARTLDELAEAVAVHAAPTMMPLPPLVNGGGQIIALATLLAGGTVVLAGPGTRFDADSVLRSIGPDEVEILMTAGDVHCGPLCDALTAAPSAEVETLRVVRSGGGRLSRDVKSRLMRAMPWITIVDGAGSSESGLVMTQRTTIYSQPEPSVFHPEEGACVVDDARARVLPRGHDGIGWLARRGAVARGYLGDRAGTVETFPTIAGQRAVVTGDRARHRRDGSIELLGRDATALRSGSGTVFAEHVERALLGHSMIDDVVVVAGRRQGVEELVALVHVGGRRAGEPGADPSDDELRRFVADLLPPHAVPDVIVRVESIVRAPTGKPDYRWAGEVALAGLERRAAEE